MQVEASRSSLKATSQPWLGGGGGGGGAWPRVHASLKGKASRSSLKAAAAIVHPGGLAVAACTRLDEGGGLQELPKRDGLQALVLLPPLAKLPVHLLHVVREQLLPHALRLQRLRGRTQDPGSGPGLGASRSAHGLHPPWLHAASVQACTRYTLAWHGPHGHWSCLARTLQHRGAPGRTARRVPRHG